MARRSSSCVGPSRDASEGALRKNDSVTAVGVAAAGCGMLAAFALAGVASLAWRSAFPTLSAGLARLRLERGNHVGWQLKGLNICQCAFQLGLFRA
eukprot:6302580-Amphidinium_carterae.7